MPHNPKLDQNLDRTLTRIWQAIYTPIADLKAEAWVTKEPVPYPARTSGRRIAVKAGTAWGRLFDCAWFHFTGTVPRCARGSRVVLLIDVGGEMLIVDDKGNPVRGLTSQADWSRDTRVGAWDKREVPFRDTARGGERVDVWGDAGCNNLFGAHGPGCRYRYARIASRNDLLHDLYFDFAVLMDLFVRIPECHARRHTVRDALHRAADVLATITDETAREARRILKPELDKKNGDPSLRFSAVGHAHIDLAWLWPERETCRKGARTFATALANMEQYPDYVFGASQPQLYEWIKERHPHLYRRIKQRVAEGRWECQGCMWVEADTNLPGGEALVRQILFGKRFFKREFGKDINHLWLPDAFGYTAALPQLLVKSGCPYFLTQKLSWSKVNSYPHHTFFWEGLDGSRVLTHFPPEDTYNGEGSPHASEWAEKNYKDKGISDRAIMLFGVGDGGGGPSVEHLESLKRTKNLAGVAPITQEPAARFFPRLLHNAHRYATWAGELYLEFHQGTYTSQARNKRFNRKIEIALRELELWGALSASLLKTKYPSADLERIWRRVLFLQFHDILPGSSITRVYNETLAEYSELMAEVRTLTSEQQTALASAVDTTGMQAPVVVMNSLSWERTEWWRIAGRWVKVTVPPMGYCTVDTAVTVGQFAPPRAGNGVLDNRILQVRFAGNGALVSVFDMENGREVLAKGEQGNMLRVYHDPGDAWDFAMDYADRPAGVFVLESARFTTDGPRALCEQVYRYGMSVLKQTIVLTEGSRRIDFITTVDWNERQKMLRVDFPVAVFSRDVTCDIQFGNIRRPTHRNTSWDMAKQEICAHKWVDLSEPDYGVAVLNDCKYGHQVKGNVINLNLLRSPCDPDPVADKARHEFTYSLYPHAGDCHAGGVPAAGYGLNVPLSAMEARPGMKGRLPASGSFFGVDRFGIVIETVKRSEDGLGTIVRMYENRGSRTKTRLRTAVPVRRAQLVNLLEEPAGKLELKDGAVELEFGPFEIHTVKLV